MNNWGEQIFKIKNDLEFNTLAIKAFNYQFKHNKVYRLYCEKLNIAPQSINHYNNIPFLPIDFFKKNRVISGNCEPETTFISSGTTGLVSSKHEVCNLKLYEDSFTKAFSYFYGNAEDYCILALLPSYIERGGSSLVYMADYLIKKSKHKHSGFYLDNYKDLYDKLYELNLNKEKVLLLGVTYALLDMAEEYPLPLTNTIIMETGGMKGKRKELIRDELHKILKTKFGVDNIHSEYGMTEILSQAYSKGNGIFATPAWMKILIRDSYDPFTYLPNNVSGGINIIDLANINSCCFIETKDLGKLNNTNSFTILGRFDNSDIRGCNLMVE